MFKDNAAAEGEALQAESGPSRERRSLTEPEPPGLDEGWDHLEGPTRLSQSVLWNLQRGWYEALGADVWSGRGLPASVSASATAAPSCVRQIQALLRDLAAAGRPAGEAAGVPLYVVELAAGSGRFGHAFLRVWQERAEPAQERLCYVLTDPAADRVTRGAPRALRPGDARTPPPEHRSE